MSALEKFLGGPKKEEKKQITFIPPVDPTIKSKLQNMAGSGFGAIKPRLITIELIREAIAEWKQEKQIYSLEITQTNCTELALSFRKILQISNLENLINVHTLRLDNNMIMRIEGLEKLVNIKWLDLSFNYISEISEKGLENLVNLTDLSLFSNQITEIKNLDHNRKLNVLSVGNNRIADCKAMAVYLRKFTHLEALCVHMNPFCKDEDSVQKILEQNQQTSRYPGSYEPLIQNLKYLKYLDWKPINEEYRQLIISNYQSAGKEDKTDLEVKREEEEMKEDAALANADLIKIKGFFKSVIDGMKEGVESGIGWENINKIKGITDAIRVCEQSVNDELNKYKEIILELQKQKDKILEQKKKELDKNEEKFIVQSKEMVRSFKREFKSFCQDLKNGKITDVKSPADAEKYVHLDKLKNELLEIEVHAKSELIEFIKNFRTEILKKNSEMVEKTDSLRANLEAKKNGLKEKIGQIVTELKNKLDIYAEKMENKEEGEQNDNEPEAEGDETVKSDKELDELQKIFQSPDFNSDIEKLTEVLDDKISRLRDDLENARNTSTETYFNKLNTNDYYRNKKRIQDIQEIYDIYWDKITKELDANMKQQPEY